jgi:hypothetical protein
MKCKKCGFVVKPNEKFCSSCGATITPLKRPLFKFKGPIKLIKKGSKILITRKTQDEIKSAQVAKKEEPVLPSLAGPPQPTATAPGAKSEVIFEKKLGVIESDLAHVKEKVDLILDKLLELIKISASKTDTEIKKTIILDSGKSLTLTKKGEYWISKNGRVHYITSGGNVLVSSKGQWVQVGKLLESKRNTI